jgi:Xaa-Pro aminopeptidase
MFVNVIVYMFQGFKLGMTTSNEPGYYEDGAFGIRIENVCVTVPADTPNRFSNKTFCKFRTFTMTPYQTQGLLDVSLLDDAELNWLNEYHATVRRELLPVMRELFPQSVDYLVAQTEPLTR